MPIWEIYYRRAFYIHSQELWNATQRANIQIERQQLVRHTRSVATRFNFLSRKWSEPCHETYSTIKIKRLGFWRSPHYHGSRVGKQAKCISSDREARRKMHHNEMGISSCRRASLLRLCGKQLRCNTETMVKMHIILFGIPPRAALEYHYLIMEKPLLCLFINSPPTPTSSMLKRHWLCLKCITVILFISVLKCAKVITLATYSIFASHLQVMKHSQQFESKQVWHIPYRIHVNHRNMKSFLLYFCFPSK